MTTVYDQVVAAGFSGHSADVMTGIVIAESGGNAWAYNPVPPDNSYGLAQINMIGSLGPARRVQYHLANNDALFDPAINLQVAYSLSGGGNSFTPWTTFTSGAYMAGYGNRTHEITFTPSHGSPNTDGGPGKGGNPPKSTLPIYSIPPDKALTASQWNAIASYFDTFAKKSAFADAAQAADFRDRAKAYAAHPPALSEYGHNAFGSGPNLLLSMYDHYVKSYGDSGRSNPFPDLPGTGALNSLGDLVTGAVKALGWLTSLDNWKRIGLFLLGAIILFVAGREYLK